MADEVNPTAAGVTSNCLIGNPGNTASNTVQLRDLQRGSVYINSQIFEAPAAQPRPRSSLHVMVVDDEPHGLDELVHLLELDHRIGKITAFTDSTEVIRYLGRPPDDDEPLDAVFLDVRMPGLDGLVLARLIARFADRPGIVLVTAFESHAVEAFDIEVDHYLLKPVAGAKLTRALDRVAKLRLHGDA
ncbi:MAG TPA: response regulator [Amycolatopsis sp.]|nr:response regulator [Amycolatopsis sp.]